MKYKKAKGCYDIVPQADEPFKQIEYWYWLEEKLISQAKLFGFEEIRLPSFETSDLFIRSSGLSSDIVSKEMYTFEDKAGRSLTLRPEWTAPIVRAFIENGLHTTTSQKFFYLGPCWRYDRQQKGRYRQFQQFGVEIFGVADPLVDVELIALVDNIIKNLHLSNTKIIINNIGDKSSRDKYSRALIEYLLPYKNDLSKDSQLRLTNNPLRILDSKDQKDMEICNEAPIILNFLTKQSKDHFEILQQNLSDLKIDYSIDPHLIRGLDYYCDTVFEINKAQDTGRQNSLGGGGRFDVLMKDLSGPDIAGLGFALGLERIIQTLIEHENLTLERQVVTSLLVPLDESSKGQCLKLLMEMRKANISCQLYYKSPKIAKALSFADKEGINFVLVYGPQEKQNNYIVLKDMKKKEQSNIPLNRICETIKKATLVKT